MKNRFLLLFLTLSALFLVISALSLSSYAADKLTVVYLKDGGTGDGSSADKAIGDINSAYDALDLSKDCKVVICGAFTQEWPFNYGIDYSGSVTFTSVYGGVDYRTAGAAYKFQPVRFICYGATAFENIDFVALSTNILFIGQCNPLSVLEGVTVKGDDTKITGGSIAKAFCLLGGYQNNQSDPPLDSNEDTHITVMSGSKIYIVPFSREILGTYTGTAHIKIGGNADISVLHGSSAYPDGIVCGDVKVEISGNAIIRNFYGCTQNTTVNSYEFTWLSGSFTERFEWVCFATPGKSITIKQPTVLKYSADAAKSAEFSKVAALFDKAELITDTAQTAAATTAAPATTAAGTTAAATTTVTATTAPATTTAEETTTPATGSGDCILIILSALSLSVVIMLLLKKRTNKDRLF